MAGATRENVREERGPGWALKQARLHFAFESQNTGLMDSFRRQYQPLSLNRLQYLIDLGRVDPTQPIDLTQLVNG